METYVFLLAYFSFIKYLAESYYFLGALHVPLIALSWIIRAHNTDLSVGVRFFEWRNLFIGEKLHWL